SRSMSIGGSAVYEAARKVMRKATRIAAYKLQVRPRDLTYENAVFRPIAHAGATAAIAHSTKKVAQKVLPVVFKRRSGFDLEIHRDAEAVTFADVAREAHLGHDLPLGMTPGLDETHFFEPSDLPIDYGADVSVAAVD